MVCVAWMATKQARETGGTKGRSTEDKPLGLGGMIQPTTQPLSWLWVRIMVQYKEKAGHSWVEGRMEARGHPDLAQ